MVLKEWRKTRQLAINCADCIVAKLWHMSRLCLELAVPLYFISQFYSVDWMRRHERYDAHLFDGGGRFWSSPIRQWFSNINFIADTGKQNAHPSTKSSCFNGLLVTKVRTCLDCGNATWGWSSVLSFTYEAGTEIYAAWLLPRKWL